MKFYKVHNTASC